MPCTGDTVVLRPPMPKTPREPGGEAKMAHRHDEPVVAVDWSKALDLERAVENLRVEMVGDWHQDPWGWPEFGFILK